MKKILILLTILFFLPSVTWPDEAIDAYDRGDYTTAYRIWKQEADEGSVSAQYNLGVMYDQGYGVPENDAEAVRWYRKAAEQGHAKAQDRLGMMYDQGLGVPRDVAEANRWYHKAAEQGVVHAQFALGLHYAQGYGVPMDETEAARWYRKAAEQGDAVAQVTLGDIYRYGRGVPQSNAEAIRWYRKAAEQGDEFGKAGLRMIQKEMLVAEVQKKLSDRGFNPGAVDGRLGPKTRSAVRRFQSASGLTVDGKVTQELLDHLNQQEPSAPFLGERRPPQPPSTIPEEKKRVEYATRLPSRSPPPPVVQTYIADFGNYHALVIGNNKYTHIRDLRTAVNDANEVAKLLRTKYGFKVQLLPNATRSDIMSALARLRRELRITDNLLIYYAGHGDLDKTTQRGYWLPVDAERDNPANWVANGDITNELKAMRARHVLVVADSCFSGTLTRSPDTVSMRVGGEEEWIGRMAQRRSRTVLTSGELEPVLDAGGGGHSVFAKAFLRTLQENNKIIDMDSLYESIRRRVVLNAQQTPLYSDIRFADHDDGDFILCPK